MSDELVTAASRFDGLAAAYDRFRPSYPPDAIAAILADLGAAADAVDIGAGTGISTRLLVATGARTIAVEPNDEMRGVARAHGLDARPGTAYATGLAATSADLVTCFQAFHWFENAAALHEFYRILRVGGRLALVWNERDTRGDAYTRGVRDIEKRFGEKESSGPKIGENFIDDSLASLLMTNGFGNIRRLRFANEQRLDRSGLVGRVRSTSYAPRSGPALEEMLRALDDLHERFCDNSGHATLLYNTDVIIGERT